MGKRGMIIVRFSPIFNSEDNFKKIVEEYKLNLIEYGEAQPWLHGCDSPTSYAILGNISKEFFKKCFNHFISAAGNGISNLSVYNYREHSLKNKKIYIQNGKRLKKPTLL